jgi:transposase-like protein
MVNTWEQSWDEFVPFLDYPVELRTIVYTTNAIESLNGCSGGPCGTGATSPTSKPR